MSDRTITIEEIVRDVKRTGLGDAIAIMRGGQIVTMWTLDEALKVFADVPLKESHLDSSSSLR